jgi:hypothetical protein
MLPTDEAIGAFTMMLSSMASAIVFHPCGLEHMEIKSFRTSERECKCGVVELLSNADLSTTAEDLKLSRLRNK